MHGMKLGFLRQRCDPETRGLFTLDKIIATAGGIQMNPTYWNQIILLVTSTQGYHHFTPQMPINWWPEDLCSLLFFHIRLCLKTEHTLKWLV